MKRGAVTVRVRQLGQLRFGRPTFREAVALELQLPFELTWCCKIRYKLSLLLLVEQKVLEGAVKPERKAARRIGSAST